MDPQHPWIGASADRVVVVNGSKCGLLLFMREPLASPLPQPSESDGAIAGVALASAVASGELTSNLPCAAQRTWLGWWW